MKIEIDIPDEFFAKDHQDELFTMFKLLCDNIDTDGLSCIKR